ncbi:MAG: hypothetical protein QOE77_149 [Blastocatellia bacterium]|jgi:hypothetical protein|nr:hypothetical protein [Blastocatellia bacterium]
MSQATFEKIDFASQAQTIEQILKRAALRELLIHKRLGNPIALGAGEKVTVVPPEEIVLYLDEGERELPEYLHNLVLQYPDYWNDAIVFANLGMKINRCEASGMLGEAVINQCRVGWEVFNSIQCLVGYDYSLNAMILCRNLFELVIGTIFLIDNPGKLNDFIDYGKVIGYEVAEQTGAEEEYLEAFKQKADYDRLKRHFGQNKWHGKTIKRLADSAGLNQLYHSFYKEASSIAHVDSFVTLGYKRGKWGFSKDVRAWSNYGDTALVFSFMSMAILYHKTVHSLELPLLKDIHAVMGRLAERGLIVPPTGSASPPPDPKKR